MALDSSDLPYRYFKKTIQTKMEKVTLDAEMIRFLMAVDENKNVAQIAKAVDMTMTKVRDILAKLLELELVVPVMKAVVYLDAEFIGFLRKKLSEAVGPMGEILIEDTLEDMGVEIDRIPVYSAADFVERIAREIPAGENRTQFESDVVPRIPKA